MNSVRFRWWFLSVPITGGVVTVMLEWAFYTHQASSSFYAITVLVGVFVFVASIIGGEKLYQKYKDR